MEHVQIGYEDGEFIAVIGATTLYRTSLHSLMSTVLGYTLGSPFITSFLPSYRDAPQADSTAELQALIDDGVVVR